MEKNKLIIIVGIALVITFISGYCQGKNNQETASIDVTVKSFYGVIGNGTFEWNENYRAKIVVDCSSSTSTDCKLIFNM